MCVFLGSPREMDVKVPFQNVAGTWVYRGGLFRHSWTPDTPNSNPWSPRSQGVEVLFERDSIVVLLVMSGIK
ncbi:hypothetical protein GGE35_002892 [Rhizobium cellulosilyticum]|uniref:Uncharacterized protein n=1 Tax=Aliirhizobium cellulosilyticum TaxID=393664 RepID=A0A7W6WQT1_9HYPH|nr:hypothetical protein [Rhizobium cellulosilyticum]MBB4412438.1 hypothetical protein [Rhizobium cellulosilyticum]MBB4447070.1 hypothetical protein [Rhizobium cellulosilyticum]